MGAEEEGDVQGANGRVEEEGVGFAGGGIDEVGFAEEERTASEIQIDD